MCSSGWGMCRESECDMYIVRVCEDVVGCVGQCGVGEVSPGQCV